MSKPITLYDQIASNNFKTVLLVLLFPILLMITLVIFLALALHIINDTQFTELGIYIITDIFPDIKPYVNRYTTLIFSSCGHLSVFVIPIIVLSSVWMIISYNFGQDMMLSFANASKISFKDNPKLYNLVENVAITAGIPTPKLYLIEDESLNAFATGTTPQNAAIALTSGIIEKLSLLELEAVIAHEMAHITNRDIRLNMLIITGLSIFGLMAEVIRSAFLNTSRRRRRNGKSDARLIIIAFFIFIALIIFNFVIAPITHMAISRKREYAADATGALLIRNPLALASALEKISKDSQVEILEDRPIMAKACIANPHLTGHKLNGLFSSHPPINKRINILKQMAGRI